MAPIPHQSGILATTAMWGFVALSRDREAGMIRPTWVALFALGYVVVWTGFSVAGDILLIGARLALGLMSLVWMAVLTAIVGFENLAPHGKRIGRLAGAGRVLWGFTLLTGF